MPSIISASQLRSVLGVSSALYNDAYLDQIIDSAESVILPMLVTFKAPIQATSLSDNVATFTTLGIHEFTEECVDGHALELGDIQAVIDDMRTDLTPAPRTTAPTRRHDPSPPTTIPDAWVKAVWERRRQRIPARSTGCRGRLLSSKCRSCC